VVMASVYALRLFIRAMHNRVGSGVDSREISLRDGFVLVPLVVVIVFMAIYPQLALRRSEGSVKTVVFPAQALAANPHAQLHFFTDTASTAALAATGAEGATR